MNKHTPGPWKGYKDQGVYVGDDQGRPVFETGCGCCTENHLTQADADLIAAAPDMLEALRFIEFNSVEGGAFNKTARAAIAKATGKNQ